MSTRYYCVAGTGRDILTHDHGILTDGHEIAKSLQRDQSQSLPRNTKRSSALVSRGHEINTKFRISLPSFRKDQPYMKNNLALFKVDEPKLIYYYLSSYMTINNNVFPYQSHTHVYLWSSSNLFNEFQYQKRYHSHGWLNKDRHLQRNQLNRNCSPFQSTSVKPRF